MNIQFSPPDISELEINEVTQALRSGWITTGPKTKLFEQKIAAYCGTEKAVCLNSATACLEMALRVLDVGPGDEVITSAYTYTASASVIHHVGAKIVLVDTAENSYEMDYDALEKAITEKTKVVIPVDIGGVMCDYDRIFDIVERKKDIFCAKSDIQKAYGRIIILADAAHSFGSYYRGKRAGAVADFTSFSFHAVKNLTTAEGGALTWLSHDGIDNDALYKKLMLWTLHGQSKDALNKMKLGAWEYDIVYPAYKCNMTDITAAIGLAQIARFEGLLSRRMHIYQIYNEELSHFACEYLQHDKPGFEGNGHLYLLRIPNITEKRRNDIISRMANAGIACNVHFKPLPLMTAYKNLGFDIKEYPNAYAQYQNEITLPMHTHLTDEEARYVARTLKAVVIDNAMGAKGSSGITVERVWPDATEKLRLVKKIHEECGEKMFIESGLMHWANPLEIDYWRQIAIEKELYLVKRAEGEVVGFFTLSNTANAYFDIEKKAMFLGKLAIIPGEQRKGYGEQCLRWLVDYALAKGCECIHTTVYTESKEAVNFIQKNKFIKLYARATKHFVVDCYELKLETKE